MKPVVRQIPATMTSEELTVKLTEIQRYVPRRLGKIISTHTLAREEAKMQKILSQSLHQNRLIVS